MRGLAGKTGVICGASDAADRATRLVCACPARRTTRDIEHHRAAHVATGAPLGLARGLLREESDCSGLQLLFGAAALLVFSVWPFERAKDWMRGQSRNSP